MEPTQAPIWNDIAFVLRRMPRSARPPSARAPLPPDIAALLESAGIPTSGLDMPTMGRPASAAPPAVEVGA